MVIAIVYGIHRWRSRARRTPLRSASADQFPKLLPNWKLLYAYALLGTLVHLFQDFTNNYGVRPFAPFNRKMVLVGHRFYCRSHHAAGDVSGAGAARINGPDHRGDWLAKPQFRGRGAAIFALICLAAVILVRGIEHRRAVTALNARTYRDEDPLRVSAFPQPINPFSWNGVVETQDFFEMVPVDSGSGEIDPQNMAIVRFKPEETPVTLAAKKSRLGRVYLDWARYPLVTVEKLEGGRYQAQFEDLRFESVEDVAQHQRRALTETVILDPQLQEMYTGRMPKSAPYQ